MRFCLPLLLLFALLLGTWSTARAQYDVPREKQLSLEEKAQRGDKLKVYRIHPNTGIPEQVNLLDTIAEGAHRYVAPEYRSLAVAYAGNANQPWQSKVFFDRMPIAPDFIYLTGYQGLLYNPEHVLFYNTKTPLTFVHYRKNFTDNVSEEVLNGTLSFNLGKKINLGISADHVSALGYYTNNRSRNVDYRIFGSYNSERYDLWAYVANDYYKQQENGGIADMSYVSDPDKYSNGRVKVSSLDIPITINSPLFNRIRSGYGYLSHRYKLGYYKSVPRSSLEGHPSQDREGMISRNTEPVRQNRLDGMRGADQMIGQLEERGTPMLQPQSVQDSTVFVPVGSISHQVVFNKASHRMVGTQHSDQWTMLWGQPVVNVLTDPNGGASQVLPNDLHGHKVLKNTLSLSLLEGFRPWVKAGLSAYLRTENHWFSASDATTQSREVRDKFFSAFVGGELARRSGKGLNFSARGEMAILGRDLGALTLEGDIRTKFHLVGHDFALRADARLLNSRPAYFAQHSYGTWSWQDNNFNFTRRLDLGAKAELSSLGTWAELRTASLQNYIYWDNDAKPLQNSEFIQTSMLRIGHKYQIGPFAWALEGAYQLSTAPSIIPLPSLAFWGDLHLDFMIAKVLQVHLGAEAYWHSVYHAPYYHPAVMQFVNQSEVKIGGGAPLINAYANFRMRTTRFYVRMFNIGEMLFDPNRETMPRYAYNPPHLEAGVVIDLKN